ncbi:MAG: DNA translocase FtsK 4TM domain-containing protein [Pseudomonadota bacterium]|nr:DNA translocase FtsK 4TM domain-containing protein [Pseudomonadota bacterium]
MAFSPNKLNPNPLVTTNSANYIKNFVRRVFGISFIITAIILFTIIVSYDPSDPSFRSATDGDTKNLFGNIGSHIADPLHLALGVSCHGLSFFLGVWGLRFLFQRKSEGLLKRIVFLPIVIAGFSMFLSAHPPPDNWNYVYGLGGIFGDNTLGLVLDLRFLEVNTWLKGVTLLLAFLLLILGGHTFGVTTSEAKSFFKFLILNTLDCFKALFFNSGQRKKISEDFSKDHIFNKDNQSTQKSHDEKINNRINEVILTRQKIDNSEDFQKSTWQANKQPVNTPSLGGFTRGGNLKANEVLGEGHGSRKSSLFSRVQKNSTRKSYKSRTAIEEEQPRLQFEKNNAKFILPPLSLLENPTNIVKNHLSDDALNENARMLENVLDDYGVKGEIVSVRPGPVVTLYELEPAAGLKASRVIGLADDIARSMSALSARVSTIPGRSVIGIELPNSDREKVLLREILSTRIYGDSKLQLPLALGKDIGGETIVTNLARMPHLLIAGTTGSGKSVGINTMILSLLYSLTPEKCRLIMIDPKMLELSVYDGIPHLLSPVVTDPKKAVVALKWAVSEMEERYRKMSKMGVRNIDGFNARVEETLNKGESLDRTVQTGFDSNTGEPIFETQHFEATKLPYIVIIVDEMADLMMVAGKEIEACIQRLAQMARAAGIHLIMATQRPSVDVITGTIKANFPSRISFQVTSKIDSRTILGEMGAEQLLGMGDMLYMANNGRITRIHGPFVSDEEVEEIVNFLKAQGEPEYVSGVIEGPDSEAEMKLDQTLGLASSDSDSENILYDQAVAIVAQDRKCSTSYIQRKLSIGYNRAAKIVETMEEQGIVSQSNHVGKREVLIPEV